MSSNNVTDEDALKALLSSAESREQERNQESTKRPFRPDRDNNNKNNNNDNKRQRGGDQRLQENDSYYGPSDHQDRRRRDDDQRPNTNKAVTVETDKQQEGEDDTQTEEEKPKPTHKPNFGVSGALAEDAGGGGNVYKGVILKFREPPEARAPNTQWRFYVFKGKDLSDTLHISKQSAYLMGRNSDICDIPLLHPSLSSQHAVLQYRALSSTNKGGGGGNRVQCHPYIMDLESTNGTCLNGVKIDAARYYQLKKGDVLTFGASTREYVLMTENTTSVK
jgi:smad nuclear-interacting protein 1